MRARFFVSNKHETVQVSFKSKFYLKKNIDEVNMQLQVLKSYIVIFYSPPKKMYVQENRKYVLLY